MRRAASKGPIVGGAIAAIMVLVAVSLLLNGTGTAAPTPTSSSASTSTVVTSSGPLHGSLNLSLAINATTIQSGSILSAMIDDANELSQANNVASASAWPIQGLVSAAPCQTSYLPIGVAVLSGYYTGANVSAGSPLPLYKPGIYNCPLEPSYQIVSYLFQPSSDLAAIVGKCNGGACPSERAYLTLSACGFWTENDTAAQSAFVSFPPGVYTVAAGDEWRDVALQHFSVVAGQSAPCSTPTLSTAPTGE